MTEHTRLNVNREMMRPGRKKDVHRNEAEMRNQTEPTADAQTREPPRRPDRRHKSTAPTRQIERLLPDQREELLPRLCLVAEAAEHAARDRRRPGLLYTAHRHAHVPAITHGYEERDIWVSLGEESCGAIPESEPSTHEASMTTATPRGLMAS